MRHDIFSLGVMPLKIAFWGTSRDLAPPVLGKYVWKDGAAEKRLKSPGELKRAYLSLAARAVLRLMGRRYADVVTACLTRLESEGRGAKDLKDDDGTVVGTRYVTAITKKLEEISI